MTRWRIILAVVFALLLLGTVYSWSRSRLALDIATYRDGTLRQPGADTAEPAMWSYTSRAIGVSHRRGLIGVVCTRSKSRGASEAEVKPGAEEHGFDAVSVPISMVRPAGARKWARYESLTNWNIVGLGMTTTSRQGRDVMTIDVPHGLPTAVFGVALGAVFWRPFMRRRRGCCPMCGYDIKGEAEKGCSECGWRRHGVAPQSETGAGVTPAQSPSS